jgi:ketosteroid isomerase-like protein
MAEEGTRSMAAAETDGAGPGKQEDLVRRAFAAFARRDHKGLLEIMHPDVEFFAPTAAIANEGRCYRGHDGIRRYLDDVAQTWALLEARPEKFREVGNHVVALGRVRARAHDGSEVESPAAWVWHVRNGLLAWGCVYADPGATFMGLSLDSTGSAGTRAGDRGNGVPRTAGR